MKLVSGYKQLWAYEPWTEAFKGEYKTEADEFSGNNNPVFTEVFISVKYDNE